MFQKTYFIDNRKRNKYFINNFIEEDEFMHIGDHLFDLQNTENIENNNINNKNKVSESLLFVFLISIPICIPLFIYYVKYS